MKLPQPYTHDSYMPFGRFKGKQLRNVPGWRLLHLYNSGELVDFFLRDYIEEHMEEIKTRKTEKTTTQQAEENVDRVNTIRRLKYKPLQSKPGDNY